MRGALAHRRGGQLLEVQERPDSAAGLGREGARGGEPEGSRVGRGLRRREGAGGEGQVGVESAREGVDGDEEEAEGGEGGRCRVRGRSACVRTTQHQQKRSPQP